MTELTGADLILLIAGQPRRLLLTDELLARSLTSATAELAKDSGSHD